MNDQQRSLGDAERLDWLRLIRSENVGPITFFQLLRHFGSAAAALEGAPELSRRGGRARPILIQSKAEAMAEVAQLTTAGGRLVAWGEPDYPRPLMAIDDPPPVISLRGHGHLLRRHTIAIVGARNASAAGCRMAAQFARELGAAGLVVASGLARGIDAAAHDGALATGTVAVLGAGIDVVYPRENAALYARIAAEGALIAEQPFGTQPLAQHFPRRNRLISGLSLGVVVIEAAARSGSLITARIAGEQGREVFAVPGSPLDPRCKGSNGLIRNGAALTENAADVIAGIEPMTRRPLAEPGRGGFDTGPGATPDAGEIVNARGQVLEKLGPTAVTVDELIRQCQMSAPAVLTVLLELELAGRLERQPGNRVSLIV